MKNVFLFAFLFSVAVFGSPNDRAINLLIDRAENGNQYEIVNALNTRFSKTDLQEGLLNYVNSHSESKSSFFATELLMRLAYNQGGSKALFKFSLSNKDYVSKNATAKLGNLLKMGSKEDIQALRSLTLEQKINLTEKILQWTQWREKRVSVKAILALGTPVEIEAITRTHFSITNSDGLLALEKLRSDAGANALLYQCANRLSLSRSRLFLPQSIIE